MPTMILYSSANAATPAFQDAALANKGKALFSYSGVQDDFQQRLAEYIGVTEDDLPCLMMITTEGEEEGDIKKFKPDSSLDLESVSDITKFMEDVLSGK